MATVFFFLFVFLFLLFSGSPIYFAMAGSAITFYFLQAPYFISEIPDAFFSGMNSYSLAAIPFFILAGELMNSSGITERIIKFANVLVGHFRGGLAYVNILTSMLFAGISGAAISDAAALGKVFIPSMEKEGYDESFAAAVTAASSIQGPLIPPSINAVVYASVMGLSVAGLFMAMLIPGILVGVGDMIIVFSKRASMPRGKEVENFSISVLLKSFFGALPALIMPVIIVGGILGGIFSPTEAGSVAAFYGLIFGFFILKTINVSDIMGSFKGALRTTTSLLFLLGAATVLSRAIVLVGLPQMFVNFLTSITDNYHIAMFLLMGLFLFIGMWLNPTSAIILFAPLLGQTIEAYEIHPLLFGTFMILVLEIGLLTPPVGACLYVVADIAESSLGKIIRATMPFIIINLALAILVIFFPQIALWIPSLLGLL